MIIAKPGPAICRLQLLKNAKIYLVFNISLLHLLSLDTPLQSTFQYKPEEKNKFEVKQILDENTSQYLVKWKNYDSNKNI